MMPKTISNPISAGELVKRYNAGERDFRGLDLGGIDLSVHSDLSNHYLPGINLEGANLKGAKVVGADLSYADLNYANLERADLYETDFAHTHLESADNLEKAKNVLSAKLFDAELSKLQQVAIQKLRLRV